MFKHMVIFSFWIFIIGCNDIPYQDPIMVQQLAKSEYGFSGIVELGTPISGATIGAHKFSGLHKGEKIGETISNRDGTFVLKLKTEYEGPLLLTTSGGLYRDLATGEMVAIKPSQELRSAITHIKMPEKTNINAWTTMAVARVMADRGFWDKSIIQLKDIDRINVDFAHISYFLTGKSTEFLNIRRQEFFDIEKDTLQVDEPRSTMHLAHGGLAQIAKEFSVRLAQKGVVISVMDLVVALIEDLSDRIFDGRNAAAASVYVGNNHHIRLDSYTMRRNLSEAIRVYSQHLQQQDKLKSDSKTELEKPGSLIDSVANETQPELFPEIEKPKPIDKPPIIRGAVEGVPQKSYLQETTAYKVSFIEDEQTPSYKVEPVGSPTSIDWRKTPIISRWLSSVGDIETAPSYTVHVSDDVGISEVKYAFGNECALLEQANQQSIGKEGTYEIPIVGNLNNTQNYCLSIWAIDQAGNASNHKVEFSLKLLSPPISVDMNSMRYDAHRRPDDAAGAPQSSSVLFGDLLIKGIVLGHAIIFNSDSQAISAKLELKKSIRVKLNETYFEIPLEKIEIEYVEYDLAKNQTGAVIVPRESAVVINQHEAVLAKIKLANFVNVRPGWQWTELKVEFRKKSNGFDAVVDGLSLITRDFNQTNVVNEYAIPWGAHHLVRTRADLNH